MGRGKTILGAAALAAVAALAALSPPRGAGAGEPRNLETRDHLVPGHTESDLQATSFEPLNSGGTPASGITRREREIVESFLTGGRGSIAAWQQSLERLPPGIRDSLTPGQPLPPGVQGRELPPSLANELPPRGGSRWMAVGYSLVLLDDGSGLIQAVWPNAFDIY